MENLLCWHAKTLAPKQLVPIIIIIIIDVITIIILIMYRHYELSQLLLVKKKEKRKRVFHTLIEIIISICLLGNVS